MRPLRKLPELLLPHALHLVQHEQLIEGPVVEGARKRLLIVVRAVLVIDGSDDEAFAGEVLAEMAHQVTIAGIPVRDDYQRERTGRCRRRGVADRLAVQRHRDRGVARDRTVVAARFLARRERGGIPHLERQRTVVSRGRGAFFRVQDVRPVLVGHLQRAYADRERPVAGELRRGRRDDVDAIRLRERSGLDRDGGQKNDEGAAKHPISPLDPA